MSFTDVAANTGNTFATPSTGKCSGTLVTNGGFEHGLACWEHLNVGVIRGMYVHSGRSAAALGGFCHNRRTAILRQTISIPPHPSGSTNLSLLVKPCLQLIFHASGRWKGPAPFAVHITWLDERLHELGVALRSSVQRRALGQATCGQWTTYIFLTEPMPDNTSFVRLTFRKAPARATRNFLIIDDVLLTPIVALC